MNAIELNDNNLELKPIYTSVTVTAATSTVTSSSAISSAPAIVARV